MTEDGDKLPIHGEGMGERPVDGEAEHAGEEIKEQGGETEAVHPLVGDNIVDLRN